MSESDGYVPLFLGCYTKGAGGDGDGISVAMRDRRTGALRLIGDVVATPAPSYLVRHPRLPVLYAVNEVAEGAVSAWSFAAEGHELEPLGTWPTGGSHPCHLALDATARHLLVANYYGGNVAALPLDVDGVPGPPHDIVVHTGPGARPDRQEGPHPHMVMPDAAADRVLTVDLGLDVVYGHRLDPATGRFTAGGPVVNTRPGTGPRHLARDGGFLYLVGELDASVVTYVDSGSQLRERSRVAASVAGASHPSELVVSPDRRFLYVANRGPDTIAVFALPDGSPRFVGEVSTGGSWPRHIALVDGWLHVANERSHTVVVFRVDSATGMPVPTGDVLAVPSPTCVLPA